ncbi:Short-chain dehydrogenase/reductase SDR [metagenome]|uniref:Short-chain dehydrogenase/reductase SDR n=1 Tax=metagenome TaxID=256318 RepID=A0A2P2C1Q4_9ZZZZ
MTRRHLITGAASGIGAAVADRLHERGDELWLLVRSEERAHQLTPAFPNARLVVADLSDPATLEKTLYDAMLPTELDSVLHVAGVVELGPVADQTLEQVRQQIDVNLVAPMVLTRVLLPALRARRGLVLVVNSGAGLYAHPDWSAYAASKFGIRGFADSLRAEEEAHGVRVTTLYPGRTATPMQAKVHEQESADYDASRWIQPDTVAASILHVLDLPEDGTIPDLTIRPVAPR